MLRYLFYAFLIYLAYRLIFHFIIPIYKTTKQVKKQFREMSARMNSTDGYSRVDDHHINQQQANQQTMPPRQEDKKAAAGDYIDFEEVK
ncbi:MAG TPA: DUF4834 family protein [Chitinophagaceae bacterium]|nr:DUF4834 family protein [Chitinophagaceae bacterium]